MSLLNSSNLNSISMESDSKPCFDCDSFEKTTTTFFETGNLSCFKRERERAQEWHHIIVSLQQYQLQQRQMCLLRQKQQQLVHSTSIDFMNLSVGLTQRKKNALVRINVKCHGQSFDDLLWSQGAMKMLGLPNAGGASMLSEVLSCEVMERVLGVELFKTEMEVSYLFINQPMTDYLVKFHNQQNILLCLGVSVTRAYAHKGRYTKHDAHKLLTKKLFGVTSSTRNIINAKIWKQILHIWCPNGKVANVVRRAYVKLDDDYKSNTMVVLSIIDSIRFLPPPTSKLISSTLKNTNNYILPNFYVKERTMSTLETKGEIKVDKEQLKVGQTVVYRPVGGAETTSEGVIKEIIIEPEIAGDTQKKVQASEEQPRILIKNSKTGKETAYKLENIESIKG
ncbi:854_t:CDS:2 [Ambispora gerdemannii]|uniref:854_t:CDS:1 n=1 Tax=Ambispora gerdemannii TaxID=144530 RepID=A0A9N9BTM0_9GLOM|nr:854_t:CDS:2 [Ambispora gerdemannii]